MAEEREAPVVQSLWDRIKGMGQNAAYNSAVTMTANALADWVEQNGVTAEALEGMIQAGRQPILEALSEAPEEALDMAARIVPMIRSRITPDTYMQVLDLLARRCPDHVRLIKSRPDYLRWYGLQMKEALAAFAGLA
jgi:hypothetical protein